MAFRVPEEFRVKNHPIYGPMSEAWGNNGVFRLENMKTRAKLNVVASDGGDWEHVSVSVVGSNDTPSWEDMNLVKDLFWSPEDAVMQLHPPKGDWVNNHHGCLHLWRPVGQTIPLPPAIMVGVKEMTPEDVEALGDEGRRKMVLGETGKFFGGELMRPASRPMRLTRPNIRNGRGSH